MFPVTFQVIKNPKILFGRVKTTFSLGCFALATYYGITQVIRYVKNDDLSTIHKRIFNEAPENLYPTFSICLQGNDIYWKNEKSLFELTGLISSQYVDLLQGERGRMYKYDEGRSTNFHL